MNFFRDIGKSIYAPGFHKEILSRGTASAVKYFISFIVVIALIKSVFVIVSVGPYLSKAKLAELEQQALMLYPDELAITLDKGIVSSNVEEPYAIPFPETWRAGVTEKTNALPKNLLVISTKSPIQLDSFASYDTMAILGKDTISYYNSDRKQYETRPISSITMDRMVIDKAKVSHGADIALTYARRIGIFLLIGIVPLLTILGLLLGTALYLLFGALVIWLVSTIQGTKLKYGASYRIGLYLITAPALYTLLIAPLSPNLAIPFGGTIILAIVAAFMFKPDKLPIVDTIPKTEAGAEEKTEKIESPEHKSGQDE
jgi:hypothetical protein